MPTLDLPRVIETCRQAVVAASQASLRHFRQNVRVEMKPDRTPVTQADKDSEAAIVRIIREAFPDHALLTEETGPIPGDPEFRWIVDPLDGTRGFSRGGTFWGPLVGFEHKGEILAGAMAMPALGETYWAARGHGAFMNGSRLVVSGVSDWQEAQLSLGQINGLLLPPHRDAVIRLATSCANTRGYGDLAACAMLLNGVADAWLEVGVQIWDLAPLKILVEEAGGKFTDFQGQPTVASGNAVATNGRVHAHVLGTLLTPLKL